MDTLPDRPLDPADEIESTQPIPDHSDVPGISAGHLCDVYAAEERQRRTQRTELMIARAHEHA